VKQTNLHVGTSPLTGTIFCGHVLKNGLWGANKKDITMEALLSVVQHALHFKKMTGKDIIISKPDGTPEYKITVKALLEVVDND